MTKARWWVIGVLTFVTVTVVLLDVTGVIFEPAPKTVATPPLDYVTPVAPSPAMTPIDLAVSATLSPRAEELLARALDDDALGPKVHALVTSTTGETLFEQDSASKATPASTLKLLTALSVLTNLPPDAVVETAVMPEVIGDGIVLVGGGDATLQTDASKTRDPSLERLAEQTAKKLLRSGVKSVELSYDDSLFTGPSVSPEWEDDYVSSGVVAPVTALVADEGRVSPDSLARYPDPAEGAAEAFGRLLGEEGIKISGDVQAGTASPTVEPMTSVESAPVVELVERMLRESDNQLAESLGRLAAIEAGNAASFAGAASTIEEAAASQDIDGALEVFDASGLSRDNRATADGLAGVLMAAGSNAELRPILTGLPVAGFDGTLFDRFLEPPEKAGAGVVRAKTGTLTGISAQSGMTTTCDGDLVYFAFLADEVPLDTLAARDALDRAAANLTRC
jgi:D-alanyl-D-alanine carboxypeptidase/D-alanyl-D-alanine-endopeptidase (penicillin-binding protein 4)